MALIESGIKLQIQNADGFIGDATKVDELLNKMAVSAQKAVDSLNKLPDVLEKLKVPKSLTNLQTDGLDKAATTFNKFFQEIKDVDPNAFTAVGKGLQGIASGLRSFTTGKFIDKLPVQLAAINRELPPFTRLIRDLGTLSGLDSFEGQAEKLTNGLTNVSKSLRQLNNNFQADTLTENINAASRGLRLLSVTLENLNLDRIGTRFEIITSSLSNFTKAVSALGRQGASIKAFPAALQGIVTALENLDVSRLDNVIATFERLSPRLKELSEVTKTFRATFKNLDRQFNVNEQTNKKTTSSLSSLRDILLVTNNAIQLVSTTGKALAGTFRLIGSAVRTVAPVLFNIGKAMLALPIRVTTSALQGLKKAFIDLPISVVTGAFRTLGKVITGFFSTLNKGVKGLLSIDKNIKRVQKAISILLAPFRALIGLVTALGAALAKLGNVFGIFNKNTAKAKTNVEEYNDSIGKTADRTKSASKEIVVVNQQMKGTSTSARLATTAVGAFFAALGARGISNAVKRLVGLQLTMKSLSLLSNVVSNSFRVMSNVIGNMTRLAFDAAASFEGIRLSINSAFAREAVQTGAFDNLVDALEATGEATDELLGRIRTLAINSPFNRETLANTFLAARNFGFAADTAEGLTVVMADLGSALNLNSQDMTEVIRALGQISSEGKATLENLNQIGDRGVPIFAQLANNLDKTRGELRKMISAGLVSSADVQNAFADIGEQVSGQAALATTSLRGLLATFNDFRKDALRNLFQPVFDQLKPLASRLLTESNIDVAIETFSKLGQSLATIVVPAIERFVFVISNIQDIIAGIPSPVLDAITTFGTFAGTILSVGLAMGALQATLSLTLGVMITFLNPISLAVGLFVALATQSEGLSNAIQQLGMSLFNLLTGVSTVQMELINLQSLLSNIPNPLTLISNALNTLRNDFVTVFGGILTTVETSVTAIVDFFSSSLSAVADWGANIVVAFADGIIATVGLVGQALSAIGDMLAFWLAPGSPPRIAPDIDTWGQLAAEEFLGGFDQADFRAISEFGSTVEDLLTSLNVEGFDTGSLVEGFSSLVADINETGTFSQDAFAQLISGAGGAQAEVAALASDFLTLQVEQEKLNQLTMDYDDALGGVDDQLSSIESREAFADEQKSIDEINRRLQNTNLSVEERTALEKELEKVSAQRTKRELVEQKKAAEARISQAQDDIDSTKERIKLSEQFGDANAGLGGADGASGRLKTPKVKKGKKLKTDDLFPGLDAALKASGERLANFAIKPPKLDAFQTPLDQIQASLGAVQGKLSETTIRVQGVFSKIQTNIKTAVDNIKKQFADWGVTIERVRVGLVLLGAVIASPLVIGAIGSLTPLLVALASPIGLVAAAVTGLATAFGFLVFNSGGLSGAIDSVTSAFDRFKTGAELGAAIEGGSVLDSIMAIDITSLDSIATGIGLALGNIVETITNFTFGDIDIAGKISELFTFEGDGLTGIFDGLFTFDESSLMGRAGAIVSGVTGFFSDNIITPIQTAFMENDSILGSIKDSYIGVYSGLFNAAAEAITSIDLTSVADTIADKLNNTGIGQTIENEFEGLFDVDLSDTIKSASEPLLSITENLESLGQFFSDTGTAISDGLQAIIDGFNAFLAIPAVNEFITNLGEAFGELFADVTNPEFVAAIQELATTLGVLFAGAVGTIAVLLQTLLVPILRNLGDVIFTAVTFINNLVDAFLLVATGVTQLFQGDISGLATIFEGIGTAALSAITGITNLGSNLAQLLLDFTINIAELIGFDQTVLQEKTDALFDRFREIFSVTNLKEFFGNLSFSDILPDWLANFSVATITGLLPQAWTDFTFADLIPEGLASGFSISSVPGLASFNLTSVIPILLQNFTLEDVWSLLPESWINFSLTDILPAGLTEAEIPGTGGATISSIFDNIVEGSNKVRDALTEAYNDPTTALATGADAASGFFQTISDRYDIIADKLETEFDNPIADALTEAVKGIANGFQLIADLFETISDFFSGEFGDPFELAVESIGKITDFVSNIGTTIGELTSAFDSIQFPEIPNPFAGIVDSAKGLTDSLGLTESDSVTIEPDVTLDSSNIEDSLEEAGSKAIDAFAGSFSRPDIPLRIQDNVNRVLDDINTDQLVGLATSVGVDVSDGVIAGLNAGDGSNTEVQTFIQTLITALQAEAQISSPSALTEEVVGVPLGEGVLNGIVKSLLAGSAVITTAVNSLVTSLRTTLSGQSFTTILDSDAQVMQFELLRIGAIRETDLMVETVLESLEELNDKGLELIETFVDTAIDFLAELVEFMLENVIDAINALLDELDGMAQKGAASIRAFVTQSKAELTKLISVFKDVGRDSVEAIVNALESLASRVIETINSQLNEIASEFQANSVNASNAPFFLLGDKLGDQLADGIVAGIEGSAFGITTAIVNEIKKAIRDAQTRLGIASPSKFSKVELGIPVGQGVEGGVVSTGPVIRAGLINSITSAVQSARGPVLESLSSFQSALSRQAIQGLNSTAQLQPALSSTEISNMNQSSVTNSQATTNNYNMTIQEATSSTAANARRNFRRMKMRRITV